MAKQTGLRPAELIKRTTFEHLPLLDKQSRTVDDNLRLWQQQDGTALTPDLPVDKLFAQWAEEDEQMTDDEREAEDRLWQEMEARLASDGGVMLRHPN